MKTQQIDEETRELLEEILEAQNQVFKDQQSASLALRNAGPGESPWSRSPRKTWEANRERLAEAYRRATPILRTLITNAL